MSVPTAVLSKEAAAHAPKTGVVSGGICRVIPEVGV